MITSIRANQPIIFSKVKTMPEKDYKEAKRFKEFRKAERLTQEEMGKIIGKTQPMVQRYETGDYLIPGRVVATLVKKLRMSHEW